VIETLDANLFHWSTPPLKLIEAAKHSAEDKRVFLSQHLLNVGCNTVREEILRMGEGPSLCVAEAGIRPQGGGSSGVKVSTMTKR
jgi:hypothetical protein